MTSTKEIIEGLEKDFAIISKNNMKKTRKNCKWWRGNSSLRKSMRNKIVLAILIALAIIFGWLAFRNTEAKEYISLEECFIRAPNIPDIPTTYVLGTLVDEELYRIIKCESGFDPTVCNKEFGCSSGMGLCQLIPGTVRYCEEKLGREIDPFNPEDNLACGIWLYENEDPRKHWAPSIDCWDKLK